MLFIYFVFFYNVNPADQPMIQCHKTWPDRCLVRLWFYGSNVCFLHGLHIYYSTNHYLYHIYIGEQRRKWNKLEANNRRKKEQKKKSSLATNLIRRRSRHSSMYARCSAVEAGGKLGTSRTTSTHRFPGVAMSTFFCTPFLSLTTPRLREPSDSPLPRRRSGCLRGNRRRLASAGGRLSGGGSGGAHGPRREARVWASKWSRS